MVETPVYLHEEKVQTGSEQVRKPGVFSLSARVIFTDAAPVSIP